MLSLLSSSKGRGPRGGRGTSSTSPDPEEAADQAKVASLNQAIEILNELFPNVDVDEFRHMLSTFSEESRLHVITENLLKKSKDGRVQSRVVEPWEKFRSEAYIVAAKNVLYKEFKGLAHSTIKAVMAENNFDYARSRLTLMDIAGKSWRFSVTNFFRGARSVIPSEPTVTATGCKELDAELFALGKPTRDRQVDEDLKIAKLLNEAEHAAASELVECECCFGDYPWTEIASCSDGHFFCHQCLLRSVQEGLYGQGRNLLGEVCSIRCLSCSASPPCTAFVPHELLSVILPPDVLQSLEDKTAAESLERSGLDLARCPFCAYAEVVALEEYRIKRSAKVALLVSVLVLFSIVSLPFVAFLVLFFTMIFMLGSPPMPRETSNAIQWILSLTTFRECVEKSIIRIQRKRRGNFFRCGNVRCARDSCLECGREWAPFHKCYEKEEDSVRIYVEKAMADAIKRTCPVCHISFVKSDGCNKLTCPCSYVMCYVCRAEIGSESYKHFCQHFRQVPGTPCDECDRCDLYVQEDEAAAIERAAEKAEADYFRKFKRPEGWKYKKRDARTSRTKKSVKLSWPEAIDADLDHILDKILV
ncbi:hypothetical protein L873DRAFT_1831224 [Choiromyces venosus 120613-1]|uniref:RING-type domain-containing protein n=1 Tax=Choiromyces venosus 120613-1 TaxID=1336337 RepID=A0A3N4J1V3_9PEZI|nr:hypothetical protein L873DRAFT_1831224 [Choiromyces venosus 120613-1]